jgi:hypothetical protein
MGCVSFFCEQCTPIISQNGCTNCHTDQYLEQSKDLSSAELKTIFHKMIGEDYRREIDYTIDLKPHSNSVVPNLVSNSPCLLTLNPFLKLHQIVNKIRLFIADIDNSEYKLYIKLYEIIWKLYVGETKTGYNPHAETFDQQVDHHYHHHYRTILAYFKLIFDTLHKLSNHMSYIIEVLLPYEYAFIKSTSVLYIIKCYNTIQLIMNHPPVNHHPQSDIILNDANKRMNIHQYLLMDMARVGLKIPIKDKFSLCLAVYHGQHITPDDIIAGNLTSIIDNLESYLSFLDNINDDKNGMNNIYEWLNSSDEFNILKIRTIDNAKKYHDRCNISSILDGEN